MASLKSADRLRLFPLLHAEDCRAIRKATAFLGSISSARSKSACARSSLFRSLVNASPRQQRRNGLGVQLQRGVGVRQTQDRIFRVQIGARAVEIGLEPDVRRPRRIVDNGAACGFHSAPARCSPPDRRRALESDWHDSGAAMPPAIDCRPIAPKFPGWRQSRPLFHQRQGMLLQKISGADICERQSSVACARHVTDSECAA